MTAITTANEALLIAGFTEAEVRYRLRFGREMYEAGYRQAEADMAARWAGITRPVTRSGPDFAELELRRWGPGGREAFGRPRPGDFPGREAEAA